MGDKVQLPVSRAFDKQCKLSAGRQLMIDSVWANPAIAAPHS
jgi:hypothetical protein